MCKAFLSVDIPMNKANNPILHQFLEKYTKKVIPSRSTLRRNINEVYDEVIENIRSEVRDRPIWLSIDETTDATSRYVANVLVGALSKDGPSKPHLLMSRELQVTNNSTITQLVLDALVLLWPGQRNEEISRKFVVFLTDAAAYMLRAGRNLKSTYLSLMHVTCLAHGLNRVAETIKGLFPLTNRLMSSVKAIFKKAPSRVLKYKDLYPNLALPPEPIQIRWGTWLQAADFYASHFEEIRNVVSSLDASDAASIKSAQSLFEMRSLRDELVCVTSNFSFIAKRITALEDRKLTLYDSVAVIESVEAALSNSSSTINKTVKGKLMDVLKKNPDFQKLSVIAKILNGEAVGSPSHNLSPAILASLKFCPITSVEVERSFSMEKAILTDRRQRFLMENLEKVVICHYELAICDENFVELI
ncbi:unnamed protein product [Orchesella dallaii]|uniref:DUF659 domain-containing protein n=1 Tax=Orchesella dallaii TaxID=48710 RepID=A0ABP1PTC6_9HEXA